MATAQQNIALLNSHVQGEQEQFLSIALQVAASEARRGRLEVANELKRLVDTARSQSQKSATPATAIPISKPRGELQSLVNVSYPKARVADVVLNPDVDNRLGRLLHQQRLRDRLRSHSLIPSSKILFVGPPGSGKTLTAAAVAGELRLPLFTIRLDTVITRYMGETAAKLRLIFDQVANIRGVYLFDEFDAIGGKRDSNNDVGEMRRVLNSFLQFLEEPNTTDSIIVAATNHAELLDRALFRRFDEILEYGLPDASATKAVLQQHLGRFSGRLSWPKILELTHGLSQADLARAAEEAIKDSILLDRNSVSTEALLSAISERRAIRETLSNVVISDND